MSSRPPAPSLHFIQATLLCITIPRFLTHPPNFQGSSHFHPLTHSPARAASSLPQTKKPKVAKGKNQITAQMLESIIADGHVTLEEFTALMKVMLQLCLAVCACTIPT